MAAASASRSARSSSRVRRRHPQACPQPQMRGFPVQRRVLSGLRPPRCPQRWMATRRRLASAAPQASPARSRHLARRLSQRRHPRGRPRRHGRRSRLHQRLPQRPRHLPRAPRPFHVKHSTCGQATPDVGAPVLDPVRSASPDWSTSSQGRAPPGLRVDRRSDPHAPPVEMVWTRSSLIARLVADCRAGASRTPWSIGPSASRSSARGLVRAESSTVHDVSDRASEHDRRLTQHRGAVLVHPGVDDARRVSAVRLSDSSSAARLPFRALRRERDGGEADRRSAGLSRARRRPA